VNRIPPFKEYVGEIEKVFNTLDSGKGTVKSRLSEFKNLKGRLADTQDLVKNHMSEIMHSFEPGSEIHKEKTITN
jgi:hypothetical protein